MMHGPPAFKLLTAETIRKILARHPSAAIDAVRTAYRLNKEGKVVNPDSYFLRFPEKPDSRIIALPAFLGGETGIAGIKWISSFPNNVASNVARASAVLILNDCETGFPIACLEGSVISAERTAASAVVAAEALGEKRSVRLGFIGCGLISRRILTMLAERDWLVQAVTVCDPDPASAFEALAQRVGCSSFRALDKPSKVSHWSDIVVVATTAVEPYLVEDELLAGQRLILHMSLRDIAPSLVLDCNNIVDDVDHVLKANTSLHLAEQAEGSRSFVTGTIQDVIDGDCHLDPGKATIVSPFGMGILDVALGAFLLAEAERTGEAITIDSFLDSKPRLPA